MQVQRQYTLKRNFMKIEFENSIRKLRGFLSSTGHQNCLDKPLSMWVYIFKTCTNLVLFTNENMHN